MSQFMEVIEWMDQGNLEIAHRIPEQGSGETKFGAQLIVRESQAAVFFRNGKGLDVFGPGRHTLSTLNLPILTKVLSLPWGFTSPFRCEAYFVSLKTFTQMRWGTKDPVAFKDRELGLVRLRAFGTFTMRVTQPLLFINSLVGTQASFDTSEIEDYLREVIVSRLNDYLGESVDSLFDLPRQYDEMGVAVRGRLAEDFHKYGVELVDFLVNRITPPEDVQRMIDARGGMAAVGNMDEFLKFQAAKAMGDAAAGGGAAGAAGSNAAAGVGVGVGAGLGMMIPGMLFKTTPQQDGRPSGTPSGGAPPAPGTVYCPKCHGPVALDGRFCSHCGHQMVVISKCPQCSKDLPADARFCSLCGCDLSTPYLCGQCQAKLPPGTRFCFACGEQVPQAT